jgi:hypothetical protein
MGHRLLRVIVDNGICILTSGQNRKNLLYDFIQQ